MDVLDIHDKFWYKRRRIPPWIWVFIIPLGLVAILGGRYLDGFRAPHMQGAAQMASGFAMATLPPPSPTWRRSHVHVQSHNAFVARHALAAPRGPHP